LLFYPPLQLLQIQIAYYDRRTDASLLWLIIELGIQVSSPFFVALLLHNLYRVGFSPTILAYARCLPRDLHSRLATRYLEAVL
jgi:hypothetical protein